MVRLSGLLANCPGLVLPPYQHKKSPFQIQICNKITFNDHTAVRFPCQTVVVPRAGIRYFPARSWERVCVNSVGRDYQQLSVDDDSIREEPFWLSLVKEAIWGLKFIFTFLVEQPSQLKYLEWPSFQSTLKTATLTLVLVAMLIVALSSIDSILCFLLAFLLRRTP
ncbi:hypothetical protein ACOSP7_005896 [Xanthoceras sorbifolium]|uniref:Uncharacterized protein n=1 Tax=Xanthoceras sorbifolium TaxID=99658 RepID=A0ABQ8IE33_9ROSI|nr:hypothetical protein JRO89_XS02G0009500 [Xanthoceras sorbifolium]